MSIRHRELIAYWFERMKQNGGKDAILRGLAKLTGGNAK